MLNAQIKVTSRTLTTDPYSYQALLFVNGVEVQSHSDEDRATAKRWVREWLKTNWDNERVLAALGYK